MVWKSLSKQLDLEENNFTKLVYNNHIYQSQAHILLHPYGFELGEPILDLQKTDTLILSFDELDSDYKNYYYTLITATQIGHLQDLLESEYLRELSEEPIYNFTIFLQHHSKLQTLRINDPW